MISRKWAERKRRVLVIVPSNLRKQWHQELSEKFFLPCTILESKPYNDDIKREQFRPFERDAIVICSYPFARNKASDVHSVPWDLVVVDEAHRLRNVYKPGNIIANTLKQALAHAPKLLLTATPLQNSLLELFGLVTFLDEQIFGDLKSFREQGHIMIATEAGAEGINLQFCSLVVNYDLPWNPQRIEQRIGRCHRYGQKHDVVVLNFLNSKNAADQRVFQLLSEKFRLFEGVFGASDDVLGAIESGVDLEKRIAAIYQTCRKTEEIQSAFDQLQLELNFEITETLDLARQQLLENVDDEVREKLRVRDEASKASLNRYEQLLMHSGHDVRLLQLQGKDLGARTSPWQVGTPASHRRCH